MPHTTLLWPIDPHTEVKQRIYKRYLRAWLPILLASGRGVTYVEGFAGPGEYDDHSPAPPIWALRTLLRAEPPPAPEAPAHVLLVEEDERRCAHLRKRMLAETGTLDRDELLRRGLVIDIQAGRCADTVPAMFAEHQAGTRPLLAIFDARESLVTFDLLRRVARTRRAETVVTLQPRHFARLASDPGDNVFGPILRRDVRKQPAHTKAAYIHGQYRRALQEAGFRHVLDVELVDERGQLLYLVYGTNHPLGIEQMKHAMWSVDPVGGVGYRDPRDPDRQLLEIQLSPQTAPLRRLILSYLAALPGQQTTLECLRDFALQETIFKRVHATAAIRDLLADGSVRMASSGRLNGSSLVTPALSPR